VLLTYGSVGDVPFVPGVPIGSVVASQPTSGVPTRTATVRPYVDFSTLDVVGVVVAPPHPPRRHPVSPTFSPTPAASRSGRPGPTGTASPGPSGTP
jgi:rod shape-determining protein MreC